MITSIRQNFSYINTIEGASLSEHDYALAGVDGLVYSCARLLMRPGKACLQQLRHWRSHSAWSKPIVLDMTCLPTVAERLKIRSDYDGSTSEYTLSEMVDFIRSLAPDYVLCTEDWKAALLASSLAIKPCQTAVHMDTSAETFLLGNQTHQAMSAPDTLVVSNAAVSDACKGFFYTADAKIALLDTRCREDFQALAEGCRCETCQQGATRAYLHHLYQHTPLLCHRLIAIHNLSMHKHDV